MAFEKITENVENISLLADTPAMTSNELKAEFDKGNKTIKTKFNKLVDDLNEKAVLKDVLEGTTLYENLNGTSEAITLSESSANFKRIQIEYFENRDNAYGMVDVLNPNGKSIWLQNVLMKSNNYLFAAKISIANTQITWDQNVRINFDAGQITTDYIQLITKVVGFNY